VFSFLRRLVGPSGTRQVGQVRTWKNKMAADKFRDDL
jgi:hypothetical protein